MSETASDRSGDVVGRRFQLESLAGRGGMGSVWRARDTETGESVAVKLMRGDDHADRFVREAVVLAELQHPRVVRYVAHGVTEAGAPYLAMEWLDGIDVAKKLAAGPLTIAEAIEIARGAADALSIAHARAVVHRDIKPSNLFLPRGRIDQLKVLDFGIARLQLASDAEGMTRTGMTLGTPGYMAPEQARGERDVDARADVFALGCVLYECITGRPPFTGEHLLGVLAKVLFEDAPRVRELRSDVPAKLEALVGRMLAKRPNERPADAGAVIAELDAISLDDAPAGRASLHALTTGEQRLLSVVLAGHDAKLVPNWSLDDSVHATAATATPETSFDVKAALATFGATVEKLADGSVIAILAGKGAATDQAAQAARCALRLRELRPTVNMALATGRGAVSDRLPVGDVIDRAVRLLGRTLSNPEDDQHGAAIRLDDASAGLLDLRFDVGGDARGLVLHGEREVVESTRTLLGKPTPCVGRERELALLDGVFAECLADSVSHGVLVTAPAGAGKSRLVGEFLRRRKTAGDDIDVWIGRGDPLSAGASFGILAQALRRACGMLDGEPRPVRHHKLRARVARHVPAAERARVTEFLAELLGCSTETPSEMLRAARQSSMLMNDQLRRAWEDFVAAESAARPVVIVLEDLQWGDPGTAKFAAAALRRATQLPLVVLAVARPEVTQRFPDFSAQTHLQLGDLTARAGERLIRAVLGDVDAALVERIVARAGGNAFYLEELIRAVADGKGDALPDTVLAMLQARLDALDSGARRTLRAASVFGQQFWVDGVDTLLGAECKTELELLVERELVQRQGESRFPNQDEYTFRHAIIRDAAYSLLTDEDRVLGHELAGRWLEAHGEMDAMTLAEHFEQGGKHEHAATWYGRAAAHALEANDFDAVLARVELGLTCGATDELRGDLWTYTLEAHYWGTRLAAAEHAGEEALRFLPVASPRWYDAVAMLARTYASLARIEKLQGFGDQLAARGLDRNDERCILAWVHVTVRLMFVCDFTRADRLLSQLTAVMRDPSIGPNVRAAVVEAFGHRALCAGDLDQSLRLTLLSVEEYKVAGNLRDANMEAVGLAIVQNELGAFAEAAKTLRDLIATGNALGVSSIVTIGKLNLGLTLAYLGDPDAERVEREALLELRASGDIRLGLNGTGYLIRILTMAGKVDAAIAEGLAVDWTNCDPVNATLVRAALAHAFLAAGRASEALPHALGAVKSLEELGLIDEGESMIQLARVEALLAAGDRTDARAALAAAHARLHQRAQRIVDPELRKSFCERVPENVRIAQLAKQHGLA